MKTPVHRLREQRKFVSALILLALLAVLIWWSDPDRVRPTSSRVPWPTSSVPQP